MCCFAQDFIWKRVNIFRLIKTDTLFWKYWNAPIAILLRAAWKMVICQILCVRSWVQFFFKFLQELRREQKMGFLQAMWFHLASTCPSKLQRRFNTRHKLCCILSRYRWTPNLGVFNLIWYAWLPLWQMKKCNVIIFVKSYWITRISLSYWNILFT